MAKQNTYLSLSYLQVVFHHPSEVTTGDFHCEVNAFTNKGHIIVLSAAVSVNYDVPTVEDLVRFVWFYVN